MNEVIKYLLYLILLGLSYLSAKILVYYCKDEVKAWKTRFLGIAIVNIVIAIGLYFVEFSLKLPVILSLIFISLTFFVIVLKKL
jgi:hypothetical protein